MQGQNKEGAIMLPQGAFGHHVYLLLQEKDIFGLSQLIKPMENIGIGCLVAQFQRQTEEIDPFDRGDFGLIWIDTSGHKRSDSQCK